MYNSVSIQSQKHTNQVDFICLRSFMYSFIHYLLSVIVLTVLLFPSNRRYDNKLAIVKIEFYSITTFYSIVYHMAIEKLYLKAFYLTKNE